MNDGGEQQCVVRPTRTPRRSTLILRSPFGVDMCLTVVWVSVLLLVVERYLCGSIALIRWLMGVP